MAKLPEPKQGGGTAALAFLDWPQPPSGVYYGRILAIVDTLGVTRPKFQNPGETEVVDVTRFFVGIASAGGVFVTSTKRVKISGHEKSTLVEFLTSILGRTPEVGFDTETLVGAPVVAVVESVASQDDRGQRRERAHVSGFQRMMPGAEAHCPPIEAFATWKPALDEVLVELRKEGTAPAPGGYAPPAPGGYAPPAPAPAAPAPPAPPAPAPGGYAPPAPAAAAPAAPPAPAGHAAPAPQAAVPAPWGYAPPMPRGSAPVTANDADIPF